MKLKILLALLCSFCYLEASTVKQRMFCNCDIEYLQAMVENFSKDKQVIDLKIIARETEACGIHYTTYNAIVQYIEVEHDNNH